ncbi:hypothetical protein Y1Q_0007984 [Alligator mississippiensis]|uniref:Uncharacterized protein n=1 Tax=Alligator mississippiensis TaxID=8496 RepID=A0A151NF30_ALLMI|nr:hypothetical protein Y1Q_0007984 [Alligator mississippiensis]
MNVLLRFRRHVSPHLFCCAPICYPWPYQDLLVNLLVLPKLSIYKTGKEALARRNLDIETSLCQRESGSGLRIHHLGSHQRLEEKKKRTNQLSTGSTEAGARGVCGRREEKAESENIPSHRSSTPGTSKAWVQAA